MYTDEPRRGTEREAHKLKCPTGPTSTKANLDGEIIQLNPSKHCWRPRQTLAWPTRFTRGPFPTPLPPQFPIPGKCLYKIHCIIYHWYIPTLALVSLSQHTYHITHDYNSTTSFIGIYLNHQIIIRTYAKLYPCIMRVCVCVCMRKCLNIYLCLHLSICKYRHMYYVPIYAYYFMSLAS